MVSFGLGRSSAAEHVGPVDSSTPWMAASEGNLALLQSSLVSLNMSLTAADENGYTLLHAAASYSQMAVMEYLLSNNVNVQAQDNEGDTVLHYAGTAHAAKALVEAGKANPCQVNGAGKTALQAKKEELEEMMQLVITKCAESWM